MRMTVMHSYKATDATPAETATAAQPAAAAEDPLFPSTRPIAHPGPSSVFLPYIFCGIYCVKKSKRLILNC
jgi:hypothetical protein